MAYNGPGLSPLQLYLRTEDAVVRLIVGDLRDAASDAARRITALEGKSGIGAVVRRSQLAIVRRELLATQRALWIAVGHRIRNEGKDVAAAAVVAEQQIEAVLFRALGHTVPDDLLASQKALARRTVTNYFARQDNGISLSQQVYKTSQLANGFVDRAVNRVILQGGSWRDLANTVRPMISPDTPGGVSFAARRLARTELNNAFHTAQRTVSDANPYADGMEWNLSSTHPKPDACDALAKGHSPGRPTGVYNDGEVPDKPHPQCKCFVATVPVSEAEFLRLVLNPPSPSTAAVQRSA